MMVAPPSRFIEIALDWSRLILIDLNLSREESPFEVQGFKVRGYLGLLRRDGGTRFEQHTTTGHEQGQNLALTVLYI